MISPNSDVLSSPDRDSFYGLLARLAAAHRSLENTCSDTAAENATLRARLVAADSPCAEMPEAPDEPLWGFPVPRSKQQAPSGLGVKVQTARQHLPDAPASPTAAKEKCAMESQEVVVVFPAGECGAEATDETCERGVLAWAHFYEGVLEQKVAAPRASFSSSCELQLEPAWSLCKQYAQSKIFSMYLDECSAQRKYMEAKARQSVGLTPRAGDFIQDSAGGSCFRTVKPHSAARVIWNIFGGMLVFYDTVTIPLLVFDYGEPLAMQAIFVLAFAFWILDVPLNFVTGYNVEGRVEMRLKRTVQRYVSTWFLSDLAILAVDAMLLLVEAGDTTGILRLGRFGRFLRILRAVRLLRILKIGENLAYLLRDMLSSEATLLIVALFRYIALLFCFNHYIACMWYGIAVVSGSEAGGEKTWVNEFGLDGEPSRYKYAMALHWSLTQFSPATNNIVPQNYTERSFAIVVVMLALVCFSSFLSGITGLLTQLQALGMGNRREEAQLREFLSSRRIKLALRNQIWRFFRSYSRQSSQCKVEGDIGVLRVIPESLMIELHTEVYLKILMSNAIFSTVSDLEVLVFEKVCHVAMSESMWVPNQDVFVSGYEATKAFVISSGCLSYATAFNLDKEHEMTAGNWVTELTLWLKWIHCGQLQALSPSNLVELDSAKFQMVIVSWGGPLCLCLKRLAILVLAHLEEMICNGLPVTDLPLGDECLVTLSKQALHLNRFSGGSTKKLFHV